MYLYTATGIDAFSFNCVISLLHPVPFHCCMHVLRGRQLLPQLPPVASFASTISHFPLARTRCPLVYSESQSITDGCLHVLCIIWCFQASFWFQSLSRSSLFHLFFCAPGRDRWFSQRSPVVSHGAVGGSFVKALSLLYVLHSTRLCPTVSASPSRLSWPCFCRAFCPVFVISRATSRDNGERPRRVSLSFSLFCHLCSRSVAPPSLRQHPVLSVP